MVTDHGDHGHDQTPHRDQVEVAHQATMAVHDHGDDEGRTRAQTHCSMMIGSWVVGLLGSGVLTTGELMYWLPGYALGLGRCWWWLPSPVDADDCDGTIMINSAR